MKLKYYIYAFTFLFCAVIVIRASQKLYKVKKNSIIANGAKVINLSHVVRTYRIYNCIFEFTYKQEIYRTRSRISLDFPKEKNDLIGKRFPVIFEKGSPSNAYILISRESFKKFELTFPDSLSWIYHY